MESWASSFISVKKLVTSFSLVCLVLSTPIFYLLHKKNTDFEKQYNSISLEIKGNYLIRDLLKDFLLVGVTDHIVEYEKGKQEAREELLVKNVLNLKMKQLKEAESFFTKKQNISKKLFIQDYYLPVISFVANHSNLILDPDLDSYYLINVLINQLPFIYNRLAIAHRDEINSKIYLAAIQVKLADINYSLKTAIEQNKKRSYKIRKSYLHFENLQSILDEVDSQIKRKEQINVEEIALKFQVLEKYIIENLREILLNRQEMIKRDHNFALMLTLGFWFFGIVAGYFLFVRFLKDHTEILKCYVHQLKQLEVSEKLSFVGEIASAIAHEVKNPLTVIDFEASSIRKNLNSPDFDKERSYERLTKISEMSHRINKISNLVTIFTRKSDNDPFENIPFKKMMEDVLYLTQLKASALGITIEVTQLDFDMACRPIQLEQVFINLVNNAIDSIETLSERWIKIVASIVEKSGEEWIVIRIVDSGTGIKKEIIANMFNSFFTTKASGKGTGLGLSIAQRIIEDHRGKIYYDEHSDHTTFVVEIPRIQPLV